MAACNDNAILFKCLSATPAIFECIYTSHCSGSMDTASQLPVLPKDIEALSRCLACIAPRTWLVNTESKHESLEICKADSYFGPYSGLPSEGRRPSTNGRTNSTPVIGACEALAPINKQ